MRDERAARFAMQRQRERREWLHKQWLFNPRCRYCKNLTDWRPGLSSKPGVERTSMHATVDHVIPEARGGHDHPSNWVLACYCCNELKGDMSRDDYIALLKKEGIRP